MQLPETAKELLRQYDEACARGDSFSEQKSRAENLLKEMLGENEIGIVWGEILLSLIPIRYGKTCKTRYNMIK
jgi:hypothetical protein